MSCMCRGLPAHFERDPRVPFLAGHSEVVSEAPDRALVKCGRCGQLWRLDLAPDAVPLACKLDSERDWDRAPSRPAATRPGPREPRLGIERTVRQTFSLLFDRRARWLLPAALVSATAYLLEFLPAEGQRGLLALRELLVAVPFALFGVWWHREILLEQTAPFVQSIRLGRRELVFFAVYVSIWQNDWMLEPWLATMSAETEAGSSALQLLAPLGLLLLLLLPTWATVRLSPILPACAIDEPFSVTAAWRLSRGHAWEMFWIGAFVGLVLGLGFFVVLLPLRVFRILQLGPAEAVPVVETLWALLTFIFFVVFVAAEVTALSLTYRRLLAPALGSEGDRELLFRRDDA